MKNRQAVASVSLDADNLWSYKRTHGDADWVDRPSYLMALAGRMQEFFSAHQIKPSVMVVGSDAAAADGPDFVSALLEMGCEVGNHSFEHEPWLHLYSPQQLRDELKRTEDAIVAAGAPKPRGFRAPGFSMSPDLMRALVELDYDYDASVLATWIGPLARQYYLRTNKDLTAEEREQRKGLFGALSDVALPNKGFAWKAAGNDGRPIMLTEIPVTVFPMARVPMHASYVIYLSGYSMPVAKAYVKASLTACRLTGTEPSLLLHPLDLLDAGDAPGLQFFPGMNLSLARKREVLDLILTEMKAHYTVLNLAEHARATALRATAERHIDVLNRGRE
ncbi:polysaccharide deacetylase family protein [Nigerium massiliense]|uniref:polysaccharide deacetylase family protein n=1 Tax=Nigerium massiliense TaxID=1522317 RepID=UPI00058B5C53|nr:polysaccharide deacetylase family protein [Nigerium massiliense]